MGSLAVAFFMNSGGGTEVASVQYGSISLPAATVSATATITSVDTTRSIVMSLGCKSNAPDTNSAWYESISEVTLTNSTTVTATGAGGGSYTSVHYFVVVQFNSGSVKSIQNVQIVGSDTTIDDSATITSVNTAKTLIFNRGALFQSDGTSPNFGNGNGLGVLAHGLELVNATTVRKHRWSQVATGRLNSKIYVVEFN